MPVFDLTQGITAQHRSGAQPAEAFEIMKRIVVQFAKRGYAIEWVEQKSPDLLVARFKDKEGTDLKADVTVADEGTTTRCDIAIKGRVFLGGLLGRLVTANTIQSRASDKIKEMLDEEFKGVPSKRAPLKPAAPRPTVNTAPPGISTLPPGMTRPPAPKLVVPVAAPASQVPTAPQMPPAPLVPPTPQAPPPAPIAASQAAAPPIAGPVVDPPHGGDELRKAAAAAGARGVGALDQLLTFERRAVIEVGRRLGRALDEASADALMAKVGATAARQRAVMGEIDANAWMPSSIAAYACVLAVAEAGGQALQAPDTSGEALFAIFEGTWDRVRAEAQSTHGPTSTIADMMEQVKEAFDAGLLSDGEVLSLRERLCAVL